MTTAQSKSTRRLAARKLSTPQKVGRERERLRRRAFGAHPRGRWSRRRFLSTVGAAPALVAFAPALRAQSGNAEVRTLFFSSPPESLSNQQFFHLAGRSYPLTKVAEDPSVLARERAINSFLRQVPDSAITHHAAGVMVPADVAAIGYQHSAPNPDGSWSMAWIIQVLPQQSLATAYSKIRAVQATGPLVHSAKRQLYNLGPAVDLRDLEEEASLLDSTDHARTLIAMHPDLLASDPATAAYVSTQHIGTGGLLALRLRNAGPAHFPTTPGQSNPTGWATLVPVADPDGVSHKTSMGLAIATPDFSPDIDSTLGSTIVAVTPAVKNDPTLGSDITGLKPATEPQDFTGKLWYRRDGATAVNQSAPGFADSSTSWALNDVFGETGLMVSAPKVNQSTGTVQINYDQIQNWFNRFLGIYVQFTRPGGDQIPVDQLPKDTLPNAPAGSTDSVLNRTNSLFAGVLSPSITIAAVPVYPGLINVKVNVPPAAETVTLILAGAGFAGPPDDPNQVADIGIALTAVFNYGIVTLMMAAGIVGIGPVLGIFLNFLSAAAVAEILSLINTRNFNFTAIAISLVRAIIGVGVGKALTAFAVSFGTYLAGQEILDEAPVVGTVARIVACVLGAATIAETTLELAFSPKIYRFDMTGTRDVSFKIYPDNSSGGFPEPPAGYQLYYKTTYLFDQGSPHVQEPVLVADYQSPLPVIFRALPRGGQVNVAVGFYWRTASAAPTDTDWCAGQGSTGLVDNTNPTVPDIHITQNKVPIGPTTRYVHTRKTVLHADGTHLWQETVTAPAYTPLVSGQQPGDLSALRSITVRQATTSPLQAGYVGYSFAGYSANACGNNARAQLDYAATINSENVTPANYATTSCGLPGGESNGVTLSYNLLSSEAGNYYLDSSSNLVRQVSLGSAPDFNPPGTGAAFASLNLPSEKLLLHPQGHLVSINAASHKVETFRLGGSLPDDQARTQLLARTHGGKGSRPGLINQPVSATVTSDGAILILEQGNNRIQALDLGGNPVPYFKGQTTPYFFSLEATAGATYLDLAVEFSGFLYVLSSNNGVFRLDIYSTAQAGSTPITTTTSMQAGRIAVDFWRNLYALNYEPLTLPDGTFPAITEPSVSLWIATPPSAHRTRS